MRSLSVVVVMALVLAACGGSDTAAPADTAQEDVPVAQEEAQPVVEAPPDESPTEAPAAEEGTQGNPIALGNPALVGDWEVMIVDVNPDAADIVAAENQFNDPPGEGQSMIMIGVRATYNGDESANFWVNMSYKVIGSAGNTFSDRCGVIPNAVDDAGETFPGATIDGNMCFLMDTDQVEGAKLILEESFSFDDTRKFFALQ